MLEYLAASLVISLVIAAILSLIRKYIPLSSRVIFGTVGISFVLGAFFPLTVSSMTPLKAAALYFCLIAIVAVALGYTDSKISPETYGIPHKGDLLGARVGQLAGSFSSVLDEEIKILENNDPADLSVWESGALEDHDETGVKDGETGAAPIPIPEAERDEEIDYEGETGCPGEIYHKEIIECTDETEPGEEAVTASVDSSIDEDPYAPVPDEEDEKVLISPTPGPSSDHADGGFTDVSASPATVNTYISAGFKAKSCGNLIEAAKHFMTALQMNADQYAAKFLALEISSVYQEMGQYVQAGMILKSVMGRENILNQSDLGRKIRSRLIYLETLEELLRITKMPNAPYGKLPDIVKIKANFETDKKIKELL